MVLGLLSGDRKSPEVLTMRETKDPLPVYARAEPDDEYDHPTREPFDPYLIDGDRSDFLDEEEENEEEDE
jgi:hypothetical protein